jgi:hypothetical protein
MADAKNNKPKYGVRISKFSEGRLVIKQTKKRGSKQNDPYVIDEQKETMVNIDDDSAIADAVRNGVAGKLKA